MISFLKQSLAPTNIANGESNSRPATSNPVKPIEEAIEALDLDPETLEWKETIFDLIRRIRDPEKPETLEELEVVREELVVVAKRPGGNKTFTVTVGFVPTVPHCSLATLIGLCLTVKLGRDLPPGLFKIDLFIRPDSHDSAEEITKQINDKERVSAAMENPNLASTVEECIQDE